jgi:catechol 2,3-dioxygenase-like lactoylglutathione lyase family enzyme
MSAATPSAACTKTETPPEEASVALVNDLHHMTFRTADMDRMISFYERIFDARVRLDGEEEGGRRHAFIEIGPYTVLHPFEVRGVQGARPSADVRARAPPTTSR